MMSALGGGTRSQKSRQKEARLHDFYFDSDEGIEKAKMLVDVVLV